MIRQISLPQGFFVASGRAGIKDPAATRDDLALFLSAVPSAAAGVFTTNRVCGAPVKVSRGRLPRMTARAVVMNSGNANACTGEQGIRDAEEIAARVAMLVGCAAQDVLVASTGVIGRMLPMERILPALDKLYAARSQTDEAVWQAARAIMTTDTFPKVVQREITLGDRVIKLLGIAKGAAMIAPHMATMLCVIMTDAALTAGMSYTMLQTAVDRSFNCISVDGHESTSDSVFLLANGAAEVRLERSDQQAGFQAVLNDVCEELARAIIRDAEGAHHFIEIRVNGCRTREDAYQLAQAIANSPLVKTAICGADPNWGRIISAAGYAGVPLSEQNLSLRLNGFLLYDRGTPLLIDTAQVSRSLREQREVEIELSLDLGREGIRFWTSDLTKEYVELNADYTT
ncbi:MAG: arginine biosynthesis bifunctional protein ArgJ [Planctomycetaceae bacterium]|nr:MAG: arginine biosynthesis bifunctional protein ArgJ [Planctomycetaceae bacterium]